MSTCNESAAVLGAGISGLYAAYALKKMGIKVTVYEKSDRAGGVIQSRRKDDWLVEEGPNTLQVQDQKLWDLFEELNLTNHIVEANKDARKRFIVRDEALHSIPSSLSGFLTTRLLSAPAKLRLAKEPFIASANKIDETLADFINRRFGNEILDYGINPFVAGVYAGDPKKLSVKHTLSSLYKMEQKYGSVLKGFLRKKKGNTEKKALISFDEGLQVLPQKLQQELDESLKLKTEVFSISKKDDEWTVQVKKNNKISESRYSAVISTLPAYKLSKLWNSSRSYDSVNELSTVEYAPISTLALGFKKEQVDHPLDGFGLLISEKEDFNILGCLFSSTLFPKRAPKGHMLLTCFIGGTRQPRLAGTSAEKLTEKALKDLNKLLGVEGMPVFNYHTFWQQAIPQFTAGYDRFLTAAANIEKENPGLFISGNFIHGVSIPDCILSSFKLAKRVEKRRGSL